MDAVTERAIFATMLRSTVYRGSYPWRLRYVYLGECASCEKEAGEVWLGKGGRRVFGFYRVCVVLHKVDKVGVFLVLYM